MKIAVLGCCHGELNRLYKEISEYEIKNKEKIDLIICCGDMHTIRNDDDLQNMAVKAHRLKKGDFWEYYEGIKKAPVLTIFIGGNHEVPNVLIPLYYGGWVAPNIFFLGNSGVINVGDIRIAGISGIYKNYDYYKGYYESEPYSEETKRSWYHIRWFEIEKMMLLENIITKFLDSNESRKLDIILTHDWPSGIERFGNLNYLLKKKPYLREDIESNKLGIPGCLRIVEKLKPIYWFSGHHHCFFNASIPFNNNSFTTEFRAIDKFKNFNSPIKYFDIPNNNNNIKIYFDLEWLSILRSTYNNYPRGNIIIDKNSIKNLKYPNKEDIQHIENNLSNLFNKNDLYPWPLWDQSHGNYKNYIQQTDFIKSIIK